MISSTAAALIAAAITVALLGPVAYAARRLGYQEGYRKGVAAKAKAEFDKGWEVGRVYGLQCSNRRGGRRRV